MRSNNADIVLGLLHDKPGWWPLDELAAAASITPALLDSALAEMKQRGHSFELSPLTGIQFVRPFMLDGYLIERGLNVRRVGRNVITFKELDSTNDTAAASATQSGSDGLVVIAEAQRKGRGRHGRTWSSPSGANILMSVLLNSSNSLPPLQSSPFLAGLAIAEAIEQDAGIKCNLKWPNDVQVDDCKIAGVLVERRAHHAGESLIIGLGVNVNASPPLEQVGRPTTSVRAVLGAPQDRLPLVQQILRRLDHWVCELTGDNQADALELLRYQWLARCIMVNKQVSIQSASQKIRGRVLNVDPMIGLTILTDEGNRVHVPAERATVL